MTAEAKANILLVDDRPESLLALETVLADLGQNLVKANSGRQALRCVLEQDFAVILLDVQMPGMDGFETAALIHERERSMHTPIVFLTASDQGKPAVFRGYSVGAVDYLFKPCPPEVLKSKVAVFVNLFQMRERVRQQAEQLIAINRNLEQEITERKLAEEALRRSNARLEEAQRAVEDYAKGLEAKVQERTQALTKEIAEHKRTEEELRQSNETLSALIQSSPMGITVLDPDGNVKLWNHASERIFGWSEQEVLGHPLPTVPREKLGEHRALRERALRKEILSGIELRRMKKDGSLIDISLSTAPLHDAKGDVCGIVGVMADITERKQLELQLHQAQKMEAIGQLAGGIAHDFNNLLTIINGYSAMSLQTLSPGDPSRNNIAQIQEAGERAALLTRQLLAFSRRQVLEPTVLDLNAVVTNLDKMLQRLIGEDIDLVPILKPGLGRVKADRGQIEQIIMNLAVNARDAMPDGGKLTIETANVELDGHYAAQHVAVPPGPYVMLAVSDTGCGMDAETQKRIFEPFFTTKELGKGTGLGLSTVYGIVKQSGGFIWVYSEPRQGTAFKIYLPRVEETAQPVEPRVLLSGSLRGSETILLAEDQEKVRKLVASILTSNGYIALEASNGVEALQLCEQHPGPIHLLVSDVVMPVMSGRELAQRLAGKYPNLKVLFFSGYTGAVVVRHGVLEEGRAFLQKPFSPTGLLRKVREVLDS